MYDHEQSTAHKPHPHHILPGLDQEVGPLLGLGLGLTGLTLGIKPRLAGVVLALTAVGALFFRDPERTTPSDPRQLVAPADGTTLAVDELYEHRYLHTDAVRIATLLAPLNVPVSRSPVSGVVQFLEHVPARACLPLDQLQAAEVNNRLYVGIDTSWGPVLLILISGPLTNRIAVYVQPGDYVQAGQRIGTVRFGSRTDLLVQRDSLHPVINVGTRVVGGVSLIGQIMPL